MRRMRSTLEVLSPDEVRRVHDAALGVLDRTGFSMPDEECLRRCAKAGAAVDAQKGVVRLPRAMAEEFLARLRAAGKPPTDETPRLAGGVSTQVYVLDPMARTRRRGLLDDNLKGIALLSHLKNVPGCNAVTVPSDVDPRVSDLASYVQLHKHAANAGGTYVLSAATGAAILDMGEALGRREFYLFETVSPLRFRKETCEMGLLFADRGHAIGIAPMVVGGTTGPATLAGTLVLTVAETIASLFAVHALSGRLDPWLGHGSHFSDPRTMLVSFGSPDQALLAVATAQMARFYGFLSGSNSALTDALVPDFQAGFEKAFSAVFAGLAGTVSIGCPGIAGADQGISFEQLVLDDEWLDAYNYVVGGIEADAESIAEELIHEVGIGGDFLAEEHTAAHIRANWWPSRLFQREGYDGWIRAGAKDALQLAHEKVEAWTEGYRDLPIVLPGAKAEAIERIAADATARILG